MTSPHRLPLFQSLCALALAQGALAAEISAPEMSSAEVSALETLVEQVEEIRGLEAIEPLRVEVMDPEELEAFLDRAFEREFPPDRLAGFSIACQILGLLEPGYDLEGELRQVMREQVLGLYDDETRSLHVVEALNLRSRASRVILAHEIVHALQDQHFPFAESPMRSDRPDDDRALATMAMIEGDATVAMGLWAAEHGGAAVLLELGQIALAGAGAMSDVPPFITGQLTFPYLRGQTFLMEIMDHPGDWDSVNATFRDWPESTEQILHPERSAHAPGEVDSPTPVSISPEEWGVPADWTLLEENTWGEFGIQQIFLNFLSPDEARSVADGWDGDRYAVLRDPEGDKYAFLWLTLWDTPEESQEFSSALSAQLSELPVLDVTLPEAEGPIFKDPPRREMIRQGGLAVTLSVSSWPSLTYPLDTFQVIP